MMMIIRWIPPSKIDAFNPSIFFGGDGNLRPKSKHSPTVVFVVVASVDTVFVVALLIWIYCFLL